MASSFGFFWRNWSCDGTITSATTAGAIRGDLTKRLAHDTLAPGFYFHLGRASFMGKMQTGRKNNDAAVLARLEEVESLLREGRWSLRAQRMLAERHGVSTRQLRNDRVKVEEFWADEYDRAGAHGHKVRLLQESKALRARAVADGQYMVAAKILMFEARITGADEPVQIQIEHSFGDMSEAELARQVLDVLPDLKLIAAIDADYEEVAE